jgi:hypothetical protein
LRDHAIEDPGTTSVSVSTGLMLRRIPMAEKTFQCQVNKSHLKKMPEGSMMVPYCCNRPMVRIDAFSMETPQKIGPKTADHGSAS